MLVVQAAEVDARLLDHAPQLAGGNCHIHVRNAVTGGGLIVSADLKLLGCAGIADTKKISCGSQPIFSAKNVLTTAPNICCGDLQVDRFSVISGK